MPAGRDGNLKLGSNDIDALNFGTGEVTDVYLGDKHVWTRDSSLILVVKLQDGVTGAFTATATVIRNTREDATGHTS